MGKNRNRNPQGTNMSDQNQEDQSQKASDLAQITGDTTTSTDLSSNTSNTGGGTEDTGDGTQLEGDLPEDANGDNSKEELKDNSTATTGDALVFNQATKNIDGSPAPHVIDQGTFAGKLEEADKATATLAAAYDQATIDVKPVVQVEAKPTEAAVTDVGASVSDGTDLTKLLNQLQESGTTQQKTLVNNLKKYMEDMAPGKPTPPAQGAMHQMRFWEILRSVVENPDPAEFRKQMFIVRAFFKRYATEKTAFNDHYINRFAESWTRSPQQLAALQRLVNIFRLTADPLTTPEKLKSVDLSRSLTYHFSEQHRQRVLSYFQQ